MTSLTEVYDGTASGVTSRRLYAGTTLVILGAILAVVAVLAATTDLVGGYAAALSSGMAAQYATVRAAGVLAGLAVPTALVGVFIVLPASRRVQAAAAISVSLCLLGVALFWYAYPHHWRNYGQQLTFEVSVVYLLGLLPAIWCLFAAVATFKRRNDPGGNLEMNVTRHNRTVLEVEESNDDGGLGGIGFLGGTPDGDVETQTNADADADGTSLSYEEAPADGRTTTRSATASRSTGATGRTVGAATSDGGSAASDISSPLEGGDAEIVESESAGPTEPTDRYCGNCEHFEYVRSSEGMVPYCARHETAMDDMDACEEWTPNR
ncbi:hypothetical protein C488_00934 [Natrinema pellirubrum DSM 15624]|uniref:Uncharacterized protein n=1 Tax=Natrinema pellirubrum (strain DSM 15624 / CIP 106293 / JCM 10476 / NCIMB 786 / 157) TaxID=797303 RepID=L0JIH5_NATP1|nr:hypothetical protein [Natrinema pellirubrum]AGB31305.1 hypothetical protein Natpe_1401 [Natrinema pellirubrum DSM 15624]ELY81758.1 hypothetical protein C488_00934 [Natrinema pellirubrum DSM 15624]